MTYDRRLVLLVVAAGLFLAGGLLLLLRHDGSSPSAITSAPSARTVALRPSAAPEARRLRDALYQQILTALAQHDAGAPPSRTAPPPPASPSTAVGARGGERAPLPDSGEHGSYDARYIQENIHEQIFPLLHSCYEAALARNPKLAGKLVFSFRIVGDAAVGGVIDEAEFTEGSENFDSEMETCTRESMMTLTLDKPPSGGGYVTVKYPVEFAPGDDDDVGSTGEAEKR